MRRERGGVTEEEDIGEGTPLTFYFVVFFLVKK
jgi:hypothetical protein